MKVLSDAQPSVTALKEICRALLYFSLVIRVTANAWWQKPFQTQRKLNFYHYTLAHNFAWCWSIFLLSFNSTVNLLSIPPHLKCVATVCCEIMYTFPTSSGQRPVLCNTLHIYTVVQNKPQPNYIFKLLQQILVNINNSGYKEFRKSSVVT